MKNLFKSKKIYKRILIIAIMVYIICFFINQEKSLISYRNMEKEYQAKINTANDTQEKLNEEKNNINTKEYIEQIAREKLDMYLPNERVYVDKSK